MKKLNYEDFVKELLENVNGILIISKYYETTKKVATYPLYIRVLTFNDVKKYYDIITNSEYVHYMIIDR